MLFFQSIQSVMYKGLLGFICTEMYKLGAAESLNFWLLDCLLIFIYNFFNATLQMRDVRFCTIIVLTYILGNKKI
jgi:hypothetical protein